MFGGYMKKIFMFMLVIFLFSFSKNVLAESVEKLTLDYQNNPYYYRIWENHTDSARLRFYNLNGEVAYCVEPGINITSDTYVSIDNSNFPFSNEILERIKLIGYYGYEYPNHSTNNYRMATQSLIWETVRNIQVNYYTGINGTGNLVDIANEKNEIMRLVNNHYVVPNINNDLKLSINKDNVLVDTNQVLNDFEIINNNSNLVVSKKGNELHIKSDVLGDYQLVLRKNKYDNKNSILYVGSDSYSQKLMKLRYDSNVELKINIHILGGKINLKKLNKDSMDNNTIGFSKLKEARYHIFDSNDNYVSELITNELGEAESEILSFGEYYLKEIMPSYGYLVDPNKYYFTIDSNNLVKEITSYEELDKKEVTIIKTIEGDYSLLSKESDITFEIYLDNKFYDTITTDKDGIAKIKLPYGKYVFHQVNTQEGYLKSDDFEVLVNELNDNQVKVIYDKKVRGKLRIIKSDLDKDIRLKDALIEVYKDNKLIYSGYTDEDGLIEIDNLFVGEYKIIEKEAPKDYILNKEEFIVKISNDNQEVELEIKNKHEEIRVPSTSLNGNNKLKYSGISIMFLGLAIIFIGERKYNKNNN